MTIKYLHTMVRVKSIEDSLYFYCTLLGLQEVRRKEYEAGKFTLIFLAPPNQIDAMLELTYNWDSTEEYSEGRNFGHLAYEVEDIYEITQKLMDNGITINRPPKRW
jgi:Lactoylglutathione lyase and related lyases